jgi:2-amino-4-hydroxy-6-hydroxymethyldihydropteridine diphosphokinase
MNRAWLGLGGNLGDPIKAMSNVLRSLDGRDDTTVRAVSPVYMTPPWGKTDQPAFKNACAEIATTLSPQRLLRVGLDIELELKRERLERWGPRVIDVDILVYEGIGVLEEPELTLPHPRMTERAFVLVPLADIAPDLVVGGLSIAEWASRSDASGIERITPGDDWWQSG